MNHKCFYRLLTVFFLDIHHQVEHVLPGSKSHQRNTAENLLDLNAPSKYENYCSTNVKIPRDFLAKNAIYSNDHCETISRFHLAISTQARTRSWPKIDNPSYDMISK